LSINKNKIEGLKIMFQNVNAIGSQQQGCAPAMNQEVQVRLKMPAGSQGRTVPTSIVMMELLWQQYGLDVLHPEVSKWLERNAPDVKGVVAVHPLANEEEFRVGPTGTIRLALRLKVDDRLRAVSAQYLLSQIEHATEATRELRVAA
jgi:hypothetical protein